MIKKTKPKLTPEETAKHIDELCWDLLEAEEREAELLYLLKEALEIAKFWVKEGIKEFGSIAENDKARIEAIRKKISNI